MNKMVLSNATVGIYTCGFRETVEHSLGDEDILALIKMFDVNIRPFKHFSRALGRLLKNDDKK